MNIVFRVDASIEMGTGHVMRCLTLADALRNEGAQCYFVCREHPGNLVVQIRDRGYQVHSLPFYQEGGQEVETASGGLQLAHAPWLGCDWFTDAQQTVSFLVSLDVDWLIVDHYALDEHWEKLLRPHCSRIMVIDDLADRHHDCDLFLDQTFGRSSRDYEKLIPANSVILTGSKYALLRQEFMESRDYSLARRKHNQLKNLLISMGGVDEQNATAMVLRSLHGSSLPADCHISIVMGENAPWINEVKSYAEKLPWVTAVKVNVRNMAELMANSDLAIGAAGSSAWERCCLGLPSIVLSYAENQKFLAESLGKSGVHWYVGRLNDISEMDLMSVVNHANASSSSLFYLSNNASNVCDGRGVVRVVRMLINFELELRPASHDDVGMLFSWRNDPAIRKYFFNSGEISIEEHSAWFENSLKMSDRILLVASSKKNPVGCLRFDFHDKAAEVSIYLNPTAVGKGLGTGILEYGTRWLKKNHPEIETINALVLRNNMASQKVFSDAGYDLNYLSYSKQLH